MARRSPGTYTNASKDQAIITKGFALCKNYTIALGRSTYFEECDAGANFWNFYFFEGLDTSQGRPRVCRGVNFVAPPAGGFTGATTINSVVEVTQIVTGLGYGTATGTGAYGTATGTGAAKGAGKDATATGRGTAGGTFETGLPTAKDGKESKGAKGASPGISSNSTASLTALTPDISTTPSSSLTTTSGSNPPAPPTNSSSTPKSTANAAAGYMAAAEGSSVALLVGMMGMALL